MHQVGDGTGEIEVYFESGVNEFDRVTFIRFVTDHLRTKGVDIEERIRLYCHVCGKEIENRDAIEARVHAGRLDIPCQYCASSVLIPRSIEEKYRSSWTYVRKQEELTDVVEKRSAREILAFQSDHRQYMKDLGDLVCILHISDIHLGRQEQARGYRTQIETDLRRELGLSRLGNLVISGDVAIRSEKEDYDSSLEFLDGLVKRFGLEPNRIVVVPGNHDVNWELSKKAYAFVFKDALPELLPEGRHIRAGDVGALLRDEGTYCDRFGNFTTHFHAKIYGSTAIPLVNPADGLLFFRPEDRIIFLALNSAWEIDHHFRDRASINMEALSRALDQLQDGQYDDWLKIAVFHHPVTSREAMNDDFMQLLAVTGFQVVLHGHVHEAREGFYNYDNKRRIHIIGAGTFGAPTREQVPGIPLQYNLLTLDPVTRTLTVETRKKEKPDGAWMADARWGDKNNPSPRYTVQLKNWNHPSVGKK